MIKKNYLSFFLLLSLFTLMVQEGVAQETTVAISGHGNGNIDRLKPVKTLSSDNNDIYTIKKYFDSTSKTYYYLTRIKHTDANGKLVKLRLALTGDNKPLGETGSDFAARTDYKLVFNASQTHVISTPSGEKKIPVGIQIINGNIILGNTPHFYTLGIKNNNELVAYAPETTGQEILNDGTYTALSAFAPLIENHKSVLNTASALGPRTLNGIRKDPRQIIAQFDNLDIVFLTCGGRGYGGVGMSTKDVVRILGKLDVKFAFNLDGGGSVTTVADGDFINWKIDGHGTKERLRATFLYVE